MIRFSRFIVFGLAVFGAACTAKATPEPTAAPSSSGMVMVPIVKPGEEATFIMGTDAGRPDEAPAHSITLTVPFAMGKYEVTAGQFCEVMNWAIDKGYARIVDGDLKDAAGTYVYLGIAHVDRMTQEGIAVDGNYIRPVEFTVVSDGSKIPSREFPVHAVSWYGAVAFANFLSEKEGLESVYSLKDFSADWSKKGYRLPTEAEWTYAVKGRNTEYVYAWGNELDGTYCNCQTTQRPYLTVFTPVGFFNGENKYGIQTHNNASAFGLYDMTGNVWELCWDWYGADYYRESLTVDPRGPDAGDIPANRYPTTNNPTRVWKGGGFENGSDYLPIATRWSSDPNLTYMMLGFRVAQTL